jgi:subtilisin family serine protease
LEEGKTEKDIPNELLRYLKKRNLGIINGQLLELPNRLLKKLVDESHVVTIHENRAIEHANYRTTVTTGARAVNEIMGLTGSGVGVAIIDSGISTFHDDLTVVNSYKSYPYGNQRVSKFVDFVNGQTLPYDDNGHGSHVPASSAERKDSPGRLEGGHGAQGVDRRTQSARSGRCGHDCRHHRGAHVGFREQSGLQHPGREPVGWRAHPRVLLDRPADARHQEAHRPGHRRRGRGRQPRGQEQRQPSQRRRQCAIRRDYGARQRTLGADRRRIEHGRHADTERRHRRQLQLAWSELHRLGREA